MTRNGAVLDLGRPLADQRLGRDVRPGLATRTLPSARATPGRCEDTNQLALERASALDVERLVDRLVADAHGFIIGEVELDPVRDLLGAPRLHPGPVLAVRLVAPVNLGGFWPIDHHAVRSADLSRQPLLDVGVQPRVGDQLRGLRPPRGHVGLPLRDRRSIFELPAAGGGVATQLARDRSGVAPDHPGRSRARPCPGP